MDVLWPHPALMITSLWTGPCATGWRITQLNISGSWEALKCHVRPFQTAYISVVCALNDLQRIPDVSSSSMGQGAFMLDEGPVGLSTALWWQLICVEQKWWTLCAVTSRYHLNNIINLVIVPLHEQHRPNFILMEYNAPACRCCIIRERLLKTGDSNGVTCAVFRAGNSGAHCLQPWIPNKTCRIGWVAMYSQPQCPLGKVGCHVPAGDIRHKGLMNNMRNYGTRNIIRTLTFCCVIPTTVVISIHCLRWGNHRCMLLKIPTFQYDIVAVWTDLWFP